MLINIQGRKKGEDMLRLILVVVAITLLRTPSALGEEASGASVVQGHNELERGDGTLPLRRPGDGTWPLRLSGEAVAGTHHLATQINLTSATSSALLGVPASLLSCHMTGANLSKHAAQGTVLVGLAQYTIKGICYNHDTDEMEVVAERHGAGATVERSFMAGALPGPEPSSFAGRLTITGSTPPAGSYTFNVETIVEHGVHANQ